MVKPTLLNEDHVEGRNIKREMTGILKGHTSQEVTFAKFGSNI